MDTWPYPGQTPAGAAVPNPSAAIEGTPPARRGLAAGGSGGSPPAGGARQATPVRAGPPGGAHGGGQRGSLVLVPGDREPASLASFRLLAMASPPLGAPRKLLI